MVTPFEDDISIDISLNYYHHDLRKSLKSVFIYPTVNDNLKEFLCCLRFLTAVHKAGIYKVIMIVKSQSNFISQLASLFFHMKFHVFAEDSYFIPPNIINEGADFNPEKWQGGKDVALIYCAGQTSKVTELEIQKSIIMKLEPAMWMVDFVLPRLTRDISFLNGKLFFGPFCGHGVKLMSFGPHKPITQTTYDIIQLREVLLYQNMEVSPQVGAYKLTESLDFNTCYVKFVFFDYIKLLDPRLQPQTPQEADLFVKHILNTL